MTRSIRSLAFIACVATAACGGGTSSAPALSGGLMPSAASSPSPIQHIVMIVQENRSVDNLFAEFPGVDGATYGYYLKPVGKTYVKTKVTLKQQPLNVLASIGKDTLKLFAPGRVTSTISSEASRVEAIRRLRDNSDKSAMSTRPSMTNSSSRTMPACMTFNSIIG